MPTPEERADAVIDALRGHPEVLILLKKKIFEEHVFREWRLRTHDAVWYRADHMGVSQATVRRIGDGSEMTFHAGGFALKEKFAMPTAQEAMAAVDQILKGKGVLLL